MRRTLYILFVLLAWPLACLARQDSAGMPTHRPVAKSQEEYQDYRSAAAAPTGSALERAAADFAQKHPVSELRLTLYLKSLRQYQRENDSAGILSSGESALALNPDNELALVLTSTVLADGLAPDDPDKAKKIATINERTERALRLLQTAKPPAASTPDPSALYRSTLQATAYSALGLMKLKIGDDAGAEKDLHAGVVLAELRPDPYIWYHLALAQDRRKKYRSALYSVEQAMQLSSANPQLQRLAEAEHDRLSKLVHPGANQPDASDDSGGTRPPP